MAQLPYDEVEYVVIKEDQVWREGRDENHQAREDNGSAHRQASKCGEDSLTPFQRILSPWRCCLPRTTENYCGAADL